MKTLDYYLNIFYPKCFIEANKLDSSQIVIDVRTPNEYDSENLKSINIPVMNRSQHQFLHKHKSIALVIVIYGLVRNFKNIKKSLKQLPEKEPVIFYCSKGRLRSPVMYMLYRLISRSSNCRILQGGICSVMGVEAIEI